MSLFSLRLSLIPLFMAASVSNADENSAGKYELRHKLKPGQSLRYEVTQIAKTVTKMNGNEEISNVHTTSVRAWKVTAATNKELTFEHLIESVSLMQQTGDKSEIRWDSRDGAGPPAMFQVIASQIGSPLASITIDPRGQEIKRADHGGTKAQLGTGQLALTFPQEPIGIGATWDIPSEIRVRTEDSQVKTIKIRQLHKLEKVVAGIATISIRSETLTPIESESVKSQVVQQLSNGTLRFDIDNGHLLSKELNWDETVVGFQGAGSMMEYRARMTEELLPAGKGPATAPSVLQQSAAPANPKR